MTVVLVDTSVWIRFFRTPLSPEARALDSLLAIGLVSTCAPIRVEVLSGAPNHRELARLRRVFDALPHLELPQQLWPAIEQARFDLARRGRQAALVDLMIALTAAEHDVDLWTLDQDFGPIRTVIPFRLHQMTGAST